jgi:two-component system NtrC family sensor kinase
MNNIQLENRRILIVDDAHSIHQDFEKILLVQNTTNLDEMEAILFGQGLSEPEFPSIDFELDSAFQGAQALEKVKQSMDEQRPYALAFVDVRMPPGWDGITTIEYLWQVDPDLQIVICTAYSDYSWQETFARLGNSDHLLILKKPFENIEVLQIANALIHKWNSTFQAKMKMAEMEHLVHHRTEKIALQNIELENQINQLNQTRAQLIQSEKLASIGQLAAGIAHEINNPLGYIHSNLDVLASYITGIKKLWAANDQMLENVEKADINNPELNAEMLKLTQLKKKLDMAYIFNDMPELISEALSGTARVKEIVADLKDYSHMNQQNMALEDINQLIEQAINISSNETKYHLGIIKDFVTLPPVPCLRSKLTQVLLNLLLNASQSIEKDGQITITTRSGQNQITIGIKDNGCGIKEDLLDKIFDPFFTTKEIGTGTGLGLHISHTIITSHGGTLSVESVQGQGTEFTISLPINNPMFEG